MNSSLNKKGLVDIAQSITVSLAIAVFIYLFIITPSQVQGKSMEPTFHTGERLYTSRLPHWFSNTQIGEVLSLGYYRGDVVVVQPPGMEPLIKRIVGLPGELIEIRDGRFYINDKLLIEDYLEDDISTMGGTFLQEGTVRKIPEDKYFVAGDNRVVSNDSRFFGFVDRDWIIGKPLVRIWPIDRFLFID